MSRFSELRVRLHSLADPERARSSQRFFKTGEGEYGAGDIFLGIAVPPLRKLVREFRGLLLPDVEKLIRSALHEERLLSLFLLTDSCSRGDEKCKKSVYDFYLKHLRFVNNWDLVDASAPYIPGPWLLHRNRAILKKWAQSESLWERRIAIVTTFHFIRQGDFVDTLRLAEILLMDKHDLIHKAVGWMLREVGKHDRAILETFLITHSHRMPRTMLRYAIEKFPENIRRRFLHTRKPL